ncbi:unnamed protein product, partial [Protopolystoma xenopodis]
ANSGYIPIDVWLNLLPDLVAGEPLDYSFWSGLLSGLSGHLQVVISAQEEAQLLTRSRASSADTKLFDPWTNYRAFVHRLTRPTLYKLGLL